MNKITLLILANYCCWFNILGLWSLSLSLLKRQASRYSKDIAPGKTYKLGKHTNYKWRRPPSLKEECGSSLLLDQKNTRQWDKLLRSVSPGYVTLYLLPPSHRSSPAWLPVLVRALAQISSSQSPPWPLPLMKPLMTLGHVWYQNKKYSCAGDDDCT